MMTITMPALVEAYLAELTSLGFLGAVPNSSQLRSFARFFDVSGHRSSLTSYLAIEWAKGHARSREPRAWARRLDTLRPFAAYLLREDPATECPQTQIFGKSHSRATPLIYTEDQILALPSGRATDREGVCE